MGTSFSAWYHPDMDTPKTERIVFVGCVHQTSANVLQRLEDLQKEPPDYLVFGGDVTGSTELERFKQLFYNHVYNRARRELGIGTPHDQHLSDQELLDYIGPTAPHDGCTLRCGYNDLRQYQKELEGLSPEVARSISEDEPNQSAATAIRNIAMNFEYYDPWVKTLPQSVRRGVLSTIEASAWRLADAVSPLQKAGTRVIIVGGNWDNAEVTREHMAGPDIPVFDAIPFFTEQGINFHAVIGTTETAGALLVFAPYWELARWTPDSDQRLSLAMHHAAEQAKHFRKTVILIGHAEANWMVHNLMSANPDQLPCGDRGIVLERFNHVIATIKPDEVVYPHQHNPLVDATGQQLSLNTKYILHINDDETVTLVTNVDDFGEPSQVIASYLPFQCFGELSLPTTGNRRPTLFGGQRQPVFVS